VVTSRRKKRRRKGYKGLQEKGLPSRSATSSLLIKSFKCMKEKIKLIVVLAEESGHIVETCMQDETEIHKSRGEKPYEGGCSGKGNAAHLVNH